MSVSITAMSFDHWKEIVQQYPLVQQEDSRGIVAIDDDTGRVLGGVVCEDWTVTACACHIAVFDRRALKAGLHTELGKYVFDQCGRSKILGHIPANNTASLKLAKHLGFTELVRIENGFDHGVDNVIVELIPENTRYYTPLAKAA